MIYTSYYTNLNRIKNISDSIVPIGVTYISAPWYAGLKFSKLYPSKKITDKFRKDRNVSEFVSAYYKELEKLDYKKIVDELYTLSNHHDIVLLGRFKYDYTCRTIASWLSKNGIVCEEINILT